MDSIVNVSGSLRSGFHTKIETVQDLLEKGELDPNYMDSVGYTPLLIASDKGCNEVVKLLLDHGADPNLRRGLNRFEDSKYTPLMVSLNSQHFSTALLLLERGADPFLKCKRGSTFCGRFEFFKQYNSEITDEQIEEIEKYVNGGLLTKSASKK